VLLEKAVAAAAIIIITATRTALEIRRTITKKERMAVRAMTALLLEAENEMITVETEITEIETVDEEEEAIEVEEVVEDNMVNVEVEAAAVVEGSMASENEAAGPCTRKHLSDCLVALVEEEEAKKAMKDAVMTGPAAEEAEILVEDEIWVVVEEDLQAEETACLEIDVAERNTKWTKSSCLSKAAPADEAEVLPEEDVEEAEEELDLRRARTSDRGMMITMKLDTVTMDTTMKGTDMTMDMMMDMVVVITLMVEEDASEAEVDPEAAEVGAGVEVVVVVTEQTQELPMNLPRMPAARKARRMQQIIRHQWSRRLIVEVVEDAEVTIPLAEDGADEVARFQGEPTL